MFVLMAQMPRRVLCGEDFSSWCRAAPTVARGAHQKRQDWLKCFVNLRLRQKRSKTTKNFIHIYIWYFPVQYTVVKLLNAKLYGQNESFKQQEQQYESGFCFTWSYTPTKIITIVCSVYYAVKILWWHYRIKQFSEFEGRLRTVANVNKRFVYNLSCYICKIWLNWISDTFWVCYGLCS